MYICVGGAYDIKVWLTLVFYTCVEPVTTRYCSVIYLLLLYGIVVRRVVSYIYIYINKRIARKDCEMQWVTCPLPCLEIEPCFMPIRLCST